ncbi:ceramide synthase 4-like [Schistocerca gregaria]|uniref:ceramide synthase 4-like n=1 Tax=Schistocerca gregaria TaxID=7010 RepID=UPI00211DFB5C|nr:ceramide synthase 4-like [Schistocerca gregaria]
MDISKLEYFFDVHPISTVVIMTICLSCIRWTLNKLSPSRFVNIDEPSPFKSLVLRNKINESLWFLIYYTFSFGYNVRILIDKPWIWDTSQYWSTSNIYPFSFKFLYFLQLSFYISALCFVLFLSNARKNHQDKYAMMIHHMASIGLILFSYILREIRIGSFVMCLHDVSDIFLESAKISRYINCHQAKVILFICFALVFFVSRLIIYPTRVLYPAVLQKSGKYYEWIVRVPKGSINRKKTMLINWKIPQLQFWFIGLGSLQLLHIYWFILILRMICGALKNRKLKEDIRSDDEEELVVVEKTKVRTE